MSPSPASALKDRAALILTGTHQKVFDLTRGRVLGRLAGMPAIKLTTTGRRSGEPRTVMLTVPTEHEGSVVLVASYGGDDRAPAWYGNLQANPEVELVFRGERYTAVARTATPEEKAILWPQATAAYRGYAGYQTKTERNIPMVICERRA